MLKRELSTPLTEDEANSLTEDEKVWLRSWNRGAEIPGETGDSADVVVDSLFPNGQSDPDADDDATPYDDMTNEDLREELAKRDLPVSGNKAELIERLVTDDEADEDDD